jgi:CRP-like cAMP-binding protein
MMADFPYMKYSKGDVIFEKGEPATVAYILTQGSVEISITQKEHKIVLAVLKPGAIFGEMALILSEQKRTAAAVALEDCEVIVIDKNAFYENLMDASVVIRTLISDLIDRLYKTTTMLLEADDLSMSLGKVFWLMTLHKLSLLDYNETVKVFAESFQVNPTIVQEKLVQMAKEKWIEFATMPSGNIGIKVNPNIEELS